MTTDGALTETDVRRIVREEIAAQVPNVVRLSVTNLRLDVAHVRSILDAEIRGLITDIVRHEIAAAARRPRLV